MCLWSFSSKYPTDNVLYYLENAYFEWKQKHSDFRACFFKYKQAAVPTPFQNRAHKNICFGSDYHVYCTEIMRFIPY